jgi:hypothetical protein
MAMSKARRTARPRARPIVASSASSYRSKKRDAAAAYLPQAGSEAREEFLTAIGVTTPGRCVSDLATKAAPGGTLQQDQGITPALRSPDAIVPYQISSYIAQAYHSAKCLNSACTPSKHGVVCTPAKDQNLFGCNTHGTMVLRSVNGISPTTGTGEKTAPNQKFVPTFLFSTYDVVPYSTAKGNVNHIPPYLVPIFGPKGWLCSHENVVSAYGYFFWPLCGSTY